MSTPVMTSPLTDREATPELRAVLTEEVPVADEWGVPSPRAIEALRGSPAVGLAVPTEYGGLGGDGLAINQTVADIAYADPSTAIILFQHFAVSARVAEWGTPEQKRDILPRLARGDWLAASAWSESGAGADKKNLSTTATVTEDGGWCLDGAKSFTTGAGLADIYLVLAQGDATGEDETAYGAAGQSFFLVPSRADGLVTDLGLDLAGMRGSATGFIELHECHVGADAMLGEPGAAPKIIAGVKESGATLGAVSVGIAQAALDHALEAARRKGLEQAAALRHRLVELSAQVDAARGIVERAGRRTSPVPGLTTLRSKLFASDTAETVCSAASQLLGSSGFVSGHPINRLLRDARAVALMGPTNELCRELLGAAWTATS